MNGALNFDIVNTSNGSLVEKYRNKSCYGGYVGNSNVRQHKHHTLLLYIGNENLTREGSKVSLKNPIDNKVVTTEDAFKYLELIKDVYFNFTVEKVETTINGANTFFNSNSFPSSYTGINDPYIYLKVTMDLSQFNSVAELKNAMFLLRNPVYSYNFQAISTLLTLHSLVPKVHPMELFQFGEFTHILNNTGNGEYNFFNRGFGRYTTKGEDTVEVKFPSPINMDTYWKLFQDTSKSHVDEVVSSNFSVKTFRLVEIEGFKIISYMVKTLLNNPGLKLSDRDIKLFKSKLNLFLASFIPTSSKFNNIKSIINE